jgi:hypothetical protein
MMALGMTSAELKGIVKGSVQISSRWDRTFLGTRG